MSLLLQVNVVLTYVYIYTGQAEKVCVATALGIVPESNFEMLAHTIMLWQLSTTVVTFIRRVKQVFLNGNIRIISKFAPSCIGMWQMASTVTIQNIPINKQFLKSYCYIHSRGVLYAGVLEKDISHWALC